MDKKKHLRELQTALTASKKERRELTARVENAKRASSQGLDVGDNEFFYRIALDFRGRVYYKGSHLNPQMGDDIKVMLTFSKKKPLGISGYRWLLWGVATAAGQDKGKFALREAWTLARLDEIRDLMVNPKESALFAEVLKDGEPALFLQRANELANALALGDGIEDLYERNLAIATYETDIAIAMDATCSGLQFLSGVSRDANGGKHVNLNATAPEQTVKADVYQAILDLTVTKYMTATDAFSQFMVNNKAHYKRRFTKKPVMTLVYSAKENSAAEYILDELNGSLEKGTSPFPLPESLEERKEILKALSVLAKHTPSKAEALLEKTDDLAMYRALSHRLAKDVREACAVELPAAMKLLDFFTQIPTAFDTHNSWTTPDGLFVKQVYSATNKIPVAYRARLLDYETGELYSKPIAREYLYSDPDRKNSNKTKNGFAPNWVHSLDGTLVRRVVNASNFDIICIHDSFAAHPADCNNLRDVLRQQFVRLIEDKPLETLIETLNRNLNEERFQVEPLLVDTWDPQEALQSEFLFC